jgi:hypothetical protein
MLDTRGSARRNLLHVLSLASLLLSPAETQAQLSNTFQYVGLSGVSAQQLFLGRPGKVYIVDKTGECEILRLGTRVSSSCCFFQRGTTPR